MIPIAMLAVSALDCDFIADALREKAARQPDTAARCEELASYFNGRAADDRRPYVLPSHTDRVNLTQ